MFAVVGWVRVSLSLVFLVASAPSSFADPLAGSRARLAIPDSVQFCPEILTRVEQMLAQSATFRGQFRRVVERPRLVLTATIDPALVNRSFRARSTIRRYDSGLMVVTMVIAPGAHLDEFIAHEFEHVLEQLEGLNLREMAERREAGAWFSGPDTVETNRAMRAGRAVSDEMRGHGSRSDNLVQ